MASSPKKGHRPAVKLPQPPLAAMAPEPPAYPVAEVSAPALAAELSAPVIVEAPVVESDAVEAPVAEFVDAPEPQLVPPVTEATAPVAPQLDAAPEPAAAPPAVEAAVPIASIEAVAEAVDFKEYGDKARALIEKGLAESRAKFVQAKTAAEEVSAAVEASFGAAHNGVVAFNVKAIEALKAGADANFDLFVSLVSAKSISEFVTLQGEFARKQFEETSMQAKALAELAGKVANDTVAPIKAHVARTFKTAV